MDEAQERNKALHAFIEWLEKEQFYGEAKICFRKGVAFRFKKEQDFMADTFLDTRPAA